MKIHQLSVFLENKPGQLRQVCQLLADEKINILTLSLADTKQFGLLRLIMQEWERAKAVLEQRGYVVNVTEVLAVEVADRPGGLAELLVPIEQAGINVEYMYAFTSSRGDKAVLVFRFDKPDAAIAALTQAGINVLSGVDLYN